jgi:hypothetical protein
LERGDFLNGSLVYSYIEDIAKRIHDPALHGAASVMVGAGFSKNADVVDDEASAPNWEELAVSMFEALYQKPEDEAEIKRWEIQKIKKTSGKNVLKLAEEYKSVFGRNKLNKFIEANINDDMYIPGNLHKKLLSLNWRDVFTTNYDTLLERTIDKINVKFNYKILTSQNDLPGSTHPRIIKLHGSVDSAKHYIICEEDYRTYPVQFAPLVNTVQQAMLETQLCLIGFSGDDPNFLSWLGWLRDNMGENCPTIYLVGLFQNMSAAEKMTLESQNITVVDLGDMFKGEVGHREALDVFLGKLTEYGQEKEKVFEPVPYKDLPFKRDFYKNIDDKYYEVMDGFLSRMKEKTNGYLAFQYNQKTKMFIYAVNDHFKELLKLEPNTQQINTLAKIVYLLRKSYTILEDNEAKKINDIINSVKTEKFKTDKILLGSWVDLSVYLLEMYRVDGRYDDYKELIDKIDKEVILLDGYSKEEFQIEKCKYLIASFDYSQAIEEINKIKPVSIDIQLKKVFLYKQIGEEEKGQELLRKASALLAQKKYTDNKTASLKGYLNLCARSLLVGSKERDEDVFSDKEYYSNSYNVRNIYNHIKDEVSNSLLLVHNESRGEYPGFNPGTYRVTYGTATRKEQDAVTNPLKYIMFQDLLCLPNTFNDHKEILSLALESVIQTSVNPIWKWSSIIRINNPSIINSFFKRELILFSEKTWIEMISNQLFNLADSFDFEDKLKGKNLILTQETIYDILSRFSIVMDDSKVISLSEKIIEKVKISDNNNDTKNLIEFFGRVIFSMNTNVQSSFLHEVLDSETIPLQILIEFVDTDISFKSLEISNDLFEKIINEIKSEDPVIRDKGITRVMIVDSVYDVEPYEDQIANAIWEQRNELGFPKSKSYYIWTWESLPHPRDIDFLALYIKYLENPKFIRSVNKGSISGNLNIENPINEYIQIFKKVSKFNKNMVSPYEYEWTLDYFVKTLHYIYDYMNNEKSLLTLKFDIFGSKKEGRSRFNTLGDFVAMLAAQAYLSDLHSGEVDKEVQNIRKLLDDLDVSYSTIEIVNKVIANDNIEDEIEKLMNGAIIGEKDEINQAMSVIEILLTFEKCSINNIQVSNHLLELIKSVRYFDVKRSRMVISKLIPIIDHPILLQEEYRNVIISAFRQNIDKLDITLKKHDRELIDTVYTLSVLIRRYYKGLLKQTTDVPKELTVILEKLSTSKLKEVRYMWEDIQLK